MTRRPIQRVVLVGIAGGAIAWGWSLRDNPAACCPGAGDPALESSIGADPTLVSDTLANGLRYYVLPISARDNRTVLRLVVKAGARHEETDQFGLAHAVEHMALRGSRRFPQRAVDAYVASLGMRRGEGVNGFTTMDETEYHMMIPADRGGALDTALAMLGGIAGEALFDSTEAGPESGVLLEEWRSGRDAYQRASDARMNVLLAGTPYASRSVIGDTSIIRRLDVGAMRRYYETWYRPDLMAVIVVGDVDPGKTTAMIDQHFGSLRRRPAPAPVFPDAAKLTRNPLQATVVPDPEATDTRIGIWFPREAVGFRTRADFRTALIIGLWQRILDDRVEDLSLEPGSPVLSGEVAYRSLARDYRAPVVGAIAEKGQAVDAVEAIGREVELLARDGVLEREVHEQRIAFFRQAQADLEGGDELNALADELKSHFLTGNAALGRAQIFQLSRDLLPTIRAGDVTAFARTLRIGEGAVVIITTTEDDSLFTSSTNEMLERLRSVRKNPGPSRRALSARRERLLVSKPVDGRIAAETRVSEAGVYEWTLSNGVRVLLKPTSFEYNEVLMRITAPGGASLAADGEYASAYLSDVIVSQTGFGTMRGAELSRWLAGTSLAFNTTVSDDAVIVEGSVEPIDLETSFELLHLMLTSPREDTVAFDRFRARSRSARRGRARNPESLFEDTLSSILANHHPRTRVNSSAFVEEASLKDAVAFWKSRFANGSNLIVVLVGDFTLDRVRPLVERYLGSLPRGASEQPRDVGLGFPDKNVRHDIRSGIAERARTAITFFGPLNMTAEATSALSALRDLVEMRLEDRLRETLGGTYGVDVHYTVDLLPPAKYFVTIDFEASPSRIESLAAVTLSELEQLRANGPDEQDFLATRAARVRDYDGAVASNDFWVAELSTHARFGWPLASIVEHPARAEALTRAELAAICAAHIPSGAYVRLTMRPTRKEGG